MGFFKEDGNLSIHSSSAKKIWLSSIMITHSEKGDKSFELSPFWPQPTHSGLGTHAKKSLDILMENGV